MTLCAMVSCAGCFTIDRAAVPTTDEDHQLVGNYGWYLFHVIPLACGNASEDAWFPWVLFRNDVRMNKVQTRFMKEAEKCGKPKASNLAYITHEQVLFEVPGLNFPIPLPYFITYREIQLSGILTKEEVDE